MTQIQMPNGQTFELTPTQENIILNDIPTELFVSDMQRRLDYYKEREHLEQYSDVILYEKVDACYKRLQAEWTPILRQRSLEIPTDQVAYTALVLSQPDYKNRSQRDAAV